MAAGIVEKVAVERGTPILEHPHERAAHEVRRHVILRRERQAYAVDRRADHELQVVDDQRSVHRDGERLVPLVEFPPVHTLRSVSEVDAAMARQIVGRFRLGVRHEIAGRPTGARVLPAGRESRNLIQGSPNVPESGVEAREQLLSGIRRRDAARRPFYKRSPDEESGGGGCLSPDPGLSSGGAATIIPIPPRSGEVVQTDLKGQVIDLADLFGGRASHSA